VLPQNEKTLDFETPPTCSSEFIVSQSSLEVSVTNNQSYCPPALQQQQHQQQQELLRQ